MTARWDRWIAEAQRCDDPPLDPAVAMAWVQRVTGDAAEDEDGEYPDVTIRQNGPQVIGERCPWCGAMILDADHSRGHD